MSKIDSAIATIEFSRQTHVEWRDYMLGHKDTVNCDCGKDHPDVKNLGDSTYHQNCIDEYDNVLEVLRGLK